VKRHLQTQSEHSLLPRNLKEVGAFPRGWGGKRSQASLSQGEGGEVSLHTSELESGCRQCEMQQAVSDVESTGSN
jgi:hypothetical protein